MLCVWFFCGGCVCGVYVCVWYLCGGCVGVDDNDDDDNEHKMCTPFSYATFTGKKKSLLKNTQQAALMMHNALYRARHIK